MTGGAVTSLIIFERKLVVFLQPGGGKDKAAGKAAEEAKPADGPSTAKDAQLATGQKALRRRQSQDLRTPKAKDDSKVCLES